MSKPRSLTSGPVIPHQAKWHGRLAAWLIWFLASSVAATLRWSWRDETNLFENGGKEPVIFCLWHNRLALCFTAYFGYARKSSPAPGMAAMVSASKDGAFLAAILECFKVRPVRGSSSRRGPQALLELTTWSERGYDLAITPDGPRGPRYVVQEGIISLAQLTGLPIIPFSYHLNWKISAKSWDQFQIPLPFSRCEMNVEKPIRIPRDVSEAEREALRLQLERTLKELSRD